MLNSSFAVSVNIPTQEEISQTFSAMNDSVGVINTLVTDGRREDQPQLECNQEIDRNARYLETMLAKSYVQSAGVNLNAYTSATVIGHAYVSSNGGLG